LADQLIRLFQRKLAEFILATSKIILAEGRIMKLFWER